MAHDRFADLSQADRRIYIQKVLGDEPGGDSPSVETLDHLIDLRLNRGNVAFYQEIGKMLSSGAPAQEQD